MGQRKGVVSQSVSQSPEPAGHDALDHVIYGDVGGGTLVGQRRKGGSQSVSPSPEPAGHDALDHVIYSDVGGGHGQ